MPQEFDDATKTHLDRDDSGIVRGILHVEQFYESTARTPQLAAREYLEKFAGVLGLKGEQLRALSSSPESLPSSDGVEFRLWAEKTQFDTTTVSFSQTYLGLPVWEAGLAVQ